ncbi:MAG TPA: radical SAM protein [Geobacteraceae bacterium]|nr:radical SAM protein [Geobacteraceae bacterium]
MNKSRPSNRLLLVYPATHKLGWARYFQLPSLSLKQVAAATPPSWEVVLADEIHGKVPFDEDFTLVGITAMTHQALRAYEIADAFRARGVPVALGGIHPTVLPEEAGAHADTVVIGEAEPVWETLLGDLLAGRLRPAYRAPLPEEGSLRIPWSRREIFSGNRYLTTQTLQASRGCPYNCPFCIVTPYFGNSFRYRDPEDILAELRSFDRKLTVFLDDNLLGDPNRAKPILEGMKGLGLRWGGQSNLRFAEDPELVRLVADSGCIGIFVGIESVTGIHANHPKTGVRGSHAELIKRVRDAGIVLEASIIFGFDDHNEGIFEKTVRFIEDCVPSLPTFHLLTPYPGTALFNRFHEEGRLLHKDWNRYNHCEVVFRPRLMSPERLYRGWLEARKEAYSWSSIFTRVMKNPRRPLINLAYNILRKGPNDRLGRDATPEDSAQVPSFAAR